MKLADTQRAKRGKHGCKRRRIDEKHPAQADGSDEGTGDGGANHPRRVERGRVQRYGIRQVGLADQVGDECLARRRVERGRAAKQKREQIDMPQLDKPGDGEQAKAEREQAHGALRDQQQFSPVEMIGGKAGPWQKQDLRRELQRHHHAHGGRIVVGQLGQHHPILGGALHPGPDIGHDGAAGPDPVVEAGQRTERALGGIAHPSTGALPPLKRPKWRAVNNPIRRAPSPSATTSAVERRSKSPTQITRI